MEKYGDPIGKAITDFSRSKRPDDIIVCSEICEDDIIPIEVLFRNEDEMPELIPIDSDDEESNSNDLTISP